MPLPANTRGDVAAGGGDVLGVACPCQGALIFVAGGIFCGPLHQEEPTRKRKHVIEESRHHLINVEEPLGKCALLDEEQVISISVLRRKESPPFLHSSFVVCFFSTNIWFASSDTIFPFKMRTPPPSYRHAFLFVFKMQSELSPF